MSDDRPRVAVDMDSTLAASGLYATWTVSGGEITSYDEHTHWDWPLEQFGDEWLQTLYDGWKYDYDEIEPMEPDLDETISRLQRSGYAVDIVTHHPTSPSGLISEGKQVWLEYHDIPYNEFRNVGGDGPGEKASLADEYVAFIDDSPRLVKSLRKANDHAAMLLIDMPYNGGLSACAVRGELAFESVRDAVEDLIEHKDWYTERYQPDQQTDYTVTDMTTVTNTADSTESESDSTDEPSAGDEKAGQLAHDVAALVTDKRDTHGDAVENQRHIAEGWTWYLQANYDLDADLDGSDVARMMELLKLSRASVGEYDLDHDRDVVGYAAIAGACAVERGDADEDDLTAFSGGEDRE